MKITNKKGTLIKDITSWENAFKEVDDAKQLNELKNYAKNTTK